jgi:hypothetical protein
MSMPKLFTILALTHPLTVGVLLLGSVASLFALVVIIALAIPILAVWFWCGVAYLSFRTAYRRCFPPSPNQPFELLPTETSQTPIPQTEEAPLLARELECRISLDEHGHGEFILPLEEEPIRTEVLS